jgi:hypothetical protein
MTMTRTIKLHRLPSSTATPGLRAMHSAHLLWLALACEPFNVTG